jgi:hypothetical protein
MHRKNKCKNQLRRDRAGHDHDALWFINNTNRQRRRFKAACKARRAQRRALQR